MNLLLWAHIAAGSIALVAGAAAMTARKGWRLHARAGSAFLAAMLVLGVSATALGQLEGKTGLGMGGVFTCYFVLTSWVAARRRGGTTGRFEIVACAVALGTAALMAWGGLTAHGPLTPVGNGPIFALAGVCLLAGLLDLNAIVRARLTAAQRIARHLWRMCFAFFIATGSFFLGQQDAMPAAWRGSPWLLFAAFAPLALLCFWLVRVRLGGFLQGVLRQPAGASG